MPAADDAVAGAQLAINDNNTTGRFLKQEFSLEVIKPLPMISCAEVDARVRQGVSFIVIDANPPTVLALADQLRIATS